MKSFLFLAKIPLFFLAISLLSTSCTDDDAVGISTPSAVVEGYLYAGQALDSLRISPSFPYQQTDDEVLVLSDLTVELASDNEVFLLDHISKGLYQNLNFIPQSGQSYELLFEYGGEQVTATTYMPEKRSVSISETRVQLAKISGFPPTGGTNLDPVEITWDNAENDYFYVVVENLEENPEFVNDFLAEFEANGQALPFSRITEPAITDFHLLHARRDLTQYGTFRIIVFRVNPEYAALYESAGTSSINISQPPSNIENGLGIFTGVSSDTVFLEVEKI